MIQAELISSSKIIGWLTRALIPLSCIAALTLQPLISTIDTFKANRNDLLDLAFYIVSVHINYKSLKVSQF